MSRFKENFFAQVIISSFFGGKFEDESHLIFFCRKVARGNSVQISPNFPAKSLSI